MTSIRSLLGSGMLYAAFQLSAQTPEPPKVIHILREDIKEGKSAAHAKSEEKFVQAMTRNKNKFPANFLGLSSLTGPSQVWFLEAHDSLVSVGDTMAFEDQTPEFATLDALDAEYRTGSRSVIAAYRADLSYHGTQLMEVLPKARLFNVITIRIRFEHDLEFAELAKTALEAADKAASDQPVAVYQVISGMPAGTYLLLEPSASFKALDDAPARGRALIQAMGESGAKKFLKSAGEVIVNEEALLFAIDPKMSYVSKEFAAGDPEFWTPKPAARKTSAAK
jgi:hypothetical protein